MERSKGQDEAPPLLHGRPAVRPRLPNRLLEALHNDVCHQKIFFGGKKTPDGFLGKSVALFSNEIGRSALSLACCVYSVPLHAAGIPKKKANAHLIINFFICLFFELISYPLAYLSS